MIWSDESFAGDAGEPRDGGGIQIDGKQDDNCDIIAEHCRFWWGAAIRRKGESLVQIRRCPATVMSLFKALSQDARRSRFISVHYLRGTDVCIRFGRSRDRDIEDSI